MGIEKKIIATLGVLVIGANTSFALNELEGPFSRSVEYRYEKSKNENLELEYQKALSKLNENTIYDPSSFIELTRKFPNSPHAHFILGNAYLISDLPKNRIEVIKEYTKTISLDPNFAAAYVNKGIALYQSSEPSLEEILKNDFPENKKEFWRQAIIEFDKAIKINPNLFSAYFNKGVILNHLEREKEAIPCFDNAIRIGLKVHSFDKPNISIEDKMEYLSTGDPLMVISGLRRYIVKQCCSELVNGMRIIQLSKNLAFISNENDPIAFTYYYKGISYARANVKDYKNAIKNFNKAIEINPNVPLFYQMLGLSYIGNDQMDQATLTLEKFSQSIDRILMLRSQKR